MSEAVPVRTLLVTVFESVIEVFLLCLAGYILSRAGVTDKATQRKLNVINVSLFTPALLFSKVAFSLTPAKLKEMWIIPLGFVIVTTLSAAVAWILSKMFKLSKSQRAFAICAAMFQNSNSLPIALIQSLVVEVPHLKWDDDDTKDQMLGRALTYLVLYSTLGMMLRWSVGVRLLSQADEEAPEVSATAPLAAQAYRDDHENGNHLAQSPEQLPHPGARETDPFFSSEDAIAEDERDERRNPTGSMDQASRSSSHARDASPSPSIPWTAQGSAHSLAQPPFKGPVALVRRESNNSAMMGAGRRRPTRTESGREFWGLPQFPKTQRIMLPEEDEDSSDEDTNGELSVMASPVSLRRRKERQLSTIQKFGRNAKAWSKRALKSINAFMTVPMYAAILSIVIALIPPLQAFLGSLKPFEQAIKSAGQCSIPVTLVVLGAFFYTPPAAPSAIPDKANGPGGAYPGENKTVFVAVLSRMIIVPLLMLPFIALIARFDLFEAAEDPVFILSATLLVSSPPALTLAQITQAASGDAFERLISKTISWSYAVLTPPLTLAYVVVGLVFGRL